MRGHLIVTGLNRVIDHLPGRTKGHRTVGIAFAGGEGVTHRHDQEVVHGNLRIGQRAPIRQRDVNLDAGGCTVQRERHAGDHQRGVAGELAGFGLAAGLARTPAPGTFALRHFREPLRPELDRNRVRLRQDIIFLGDPPGITPFAGGEITSLPAVVADRVDGLGRPAEPRAGVAGSRRRGARIRRARIAAVGIVETTLGAPDHIRWRSRSLIALGRIATLVHGE